MNIITDIIKLLIESVGEFLQLLINIFKTNHAYKGRFGKIAQVLARRHKQNGIAIGNKFISLKNSLNGGMMLLGKTGIGKSSKLFKMQLFGAKHTGMNYINLDGAGELRADCGAYMVEHLGYQEDVLNFADASKSSVSWNPIESLPYERVNRFANEFTTINMNEDPKDPIWNLMTANLISMAIRLLKRIDLKEYINLYNVRYVIKVLQGSPEKIDKLMVKYADAVLFDDFKACINNDERFLNSILSNTLAATQMFEDPNVAKTTSATTLDFESYRKSKKVLYLQNDVMSQAYLSPLNSLFFTSWFAYITEQGIPPKNSKTIVFSIDEASSLKIKKDIIPLVVSQLRKYNSFGIWGYQSFSQVQDLLGLQGARTLKQNTSNVLYMGNQNLETARELSNALGKYSYTDDNGVQKARELRTQDEAMYLEDCKKGGILLSGQHRPMRLKNIKAFYEITAYKKWANKDPEPIVPIAQEMPPLLPIDELIESINALTKEDNAEY